MGNTEKNDVLGNRISTLLREFAENNAARHDSQGEGVRQFSLCLSSGDGLLSANQIETNQVEWLTVLASFPVGDCKPVQNSVGILGDWLESNNFDAPSLTIYQTSATNQYAITMNFADDRSEAERNTADIRARGRQAEQDVVSDDASEIEASDIRYLAGAFTQTSRGWTEVNSECQ